MRARTSAIIVAAGKGTRMGPDMDKMFIELAGAPLIAHTWQRFDSSPSVDDLVIVVRSGLENSFAQIARQHSFRKPYCLVRGGAERQNSVWNGLEAVPAQTEVVLIQDGARPCTTEDLIARCAQAAAQTGAAVAAQRVTDTIKESDGANRIARTVDRSKLWSVQTPQSFRVTVIRSALMAVREKGLVVTDDTAACELIGQPVLLVESVTPNPKATSPADLPLIELLLTRNPILS